MMSSRCENFCGLLTKLFLLFYPVSPLIMIYGNSDITRRDRYIIVNNIFLGQEKPKCVTKPKSVSAILNKRHYILKTEHLTALSEEMET